MLVQPPVGIPQPVPEQSFVLGLSQELKPFLIERNGLFKAPLAGKQGCQIVPISDAEIGRWVKAVEPVIAEFKKDLVTKGYKPGEVDSWISFLRERIEYWKGQEKVKNIPTAYQY